MPDTEENRESTTAIRLLALALSGFSLFAGTSAFAENAPMLIPRGQRFERVFKSDVSYTNPVAGIEWRVEFRSPGGETNSVPGFWDGNKTWRVRFLPEVPGRWSYRAICSDTNNAGLHGQGGEFLCIAGARGNRFDEHGSIRAARDGNYFEHADRTPLFLTTEVAWDLVRHSKPADLENHLHARADQGFTALAWTLAPGKDERKRTALLTDAPGGIDLDFFQRLDAKVDAITRAGLVSVIVPSWEISPSRDAAQEAQVISLLRHALARWSANPVVWVIAVESDSTAANLGRWRRIGQETFANGTHGPVLLLPGASHWLWDEFREESWLAGLAFQTTHLKSEDALQWFLTGPLASEWKRTPRRPVMNLWPAGESTDAAKPTARNLLWWGLLLNSPAGVSAQLRADASTSETSPFTDGGAALIASQVMNTIEFHKLRPAPGILAAQPGSESPLEFISAAATEKQDVLLIYTPRSRTVSLRTSAIPARHSDVWINPRTGERLTAVAVVAQATAKYQSPGAGDWVLLIQTGK